MNWLKEEVEIDIETDYIVQTEWTMDTQLRTEVTGRNVNPIYAVEFA